jgi:hypothetical protein
MSQLTNLKNNLMTAIQSITGNISVYYPEVTWSNNVFYGGEPLIHNMNRGKQILCHYWRDKTNYQNESDGVDGTLLSTWNINLYAFRKPNPKISSEEESETILDAIMSDILKAIRATNGLNLSNGDDAEIERIELVPFGFVYKTKISLNNSYTNANR